MLHPLKPAIIQNRSFWSLQQMQPHKLLVTLHPCRVVNVFTKTCRQRYRKAPVLPCGTLCQ